MVVTLAQLVAVPALGLRVLTPLTASGATKPVAWVHSSDLVDPTPFVGADHLLLTTGTQFGLEEAGEKFDGYVDRLVAAGVGGLGFGTEVVRSGTPAGLIRACAAGGLPVVEVPYRTPFVAVVRWVADELDAQRHARDDWTLHAQQALSRAALSPGRLGAVVDELAKQFPATVTLFDSRGVVVAGPPAPEPVAAEVTRLLRRRMRSGSAVETGGRRTQLQTLGRRHELRGVLAVTPEARLDSAATAVVTSAVALAEFALEDAARRRDRDRVLDGELLVLLHAGEVTTVQRVLEAGGRRLPDPPLRVLLCANETVDLDTTTSATTAFFAPYDGRVALLVADDWAASAVAAVSGAGSAVGVSGRCDLAGIGVALGQAGRALDQASPGRALYADRDLDPLWGLLPRDRLAELAEARLAALDDDPDGRQLRRTLRVWLRHNAQWDPAARELRLHRHTVKAQVRRAETLLDLRLGTFAGKAQLWALLTVAD